MSKNFLPLALFFLAGSALLAQSTDKIPDHLLNRRFGLVIGANNGGPGRHNLQFALDDARAVMKVLEDMGGLQSGDGRLLDQPTRENFFREMDWLADKVNRAKGQFRRVEVFVYYSGHSDEENLFLAGERISYREFRDSITAVNADVRVAILDSCASGSFIQPKGVIRRSPFLLNTAYDMKGYAFITSSSGDEASQESKRLGGSFFTHNLVSGMRGAADMNLDGRITLTEAYQFAFDETLQQTEKTMHGPQHPNYNIQMSGTGDVVVTDISRSPALLVLGADIVGKLYIHSQANVLVVELSKLAEREITIGLEQGEYRVILVRDSFIYETRVLLTKDQSSRLGYKQFEKVEKISTRARGRLQPPFPEFRPAKKAPWRLDIFGGIAQVSPGDLNKRAEFDQSNFEFNLNERFLYKRLKGDYTFYTNEISGGLGRLRFSLLGGARLRRDLNDWLSVSLELSAFAARRQSSYENRSTIIEAGGEQYIFSAFVPEFVLSTDGLLAAIGMQAAKNFGRRWRGEVHLAAGPVLARCRYYSEYKNFPLTDLGDIVQKEFSSSSIEEKGLGTGISLAAGAGLEWKLNRSAGFFLELDYAYRVVRGLSGPGWSRLENETKEFSGTWGIKYIRLVSEWGILESEYPSNYWPEGNNYNKIRDFKLDLSGMEAIIGFYFRL